MDWRDDFWGGSLDARWNTAVTGTGTAAVVDAQDGGIMRFACPAADDTVTLNWQAIRSLHINKKVTFETRIKTSAANDDRYLVIELRFDANNEILIRIIRDFNVDITTINGGAPTTQTSNQAVDTAFHVYKIEAFPAGEVHFYFDNTELNVSPLTTNIPDDAGDYLQPQIYCLNRNPGAGGSINYDVDYIYVRQNR